MRRLWRWFLGWIEYGERRLTLHRAKDLPAGRYDLTIVSADRERAYLKVIEEE